MVTKLSIFLDTQQCVLGTQLGTQLKLKKEITSEQINIINVL